MHSWGHVNGLNRNPMYAHRNLACKDRKLVCAHRKLLYVARKVLYVNRYLTYSVYHGALSGAGLTGMYQQPITP